MMVLCITPDDSFSSGRSMTRGADDVRGEGATRVGEGATRVGEGEACFGARGKVLGDDDGSGDGACADGKAFGSDAGTSVS